MDRRETITTLHRGLPIDPANACPTEQAVIAVLDIHTSVTITRSGMMCRPVVTTTCLDDGQEWPCTTVRALCAALGVGLP